MSFRLLLDKVSMLLVVFPHERSNWLFLRRLAISSSSILDSSVILRSIVLLSIQHPSVPPSLLEKHFRPNCTRHASVKKKEREKKRASPTREQFARVTVHIK